MRKTTMLMSGAALMAATSLQAAPLTVDVYNPGKNAIFPVSSELISGEHEAILVDAQFSVQDGQALVEMIRQSGKKLKAVYISGGDPDYYFGLQAVRAAFPDVPVLASAHVTEHIKATHAAKLAYWGPILGQGAPAQVTVPQVLNDDYLTVDGERIEIRELNTPNAYLWLPQTKTALGGVLVTAGQHVWMADSQTPVARAEWVAALNRLLTLSPERVIPGHFLGQAPSGTDAVTFTRDYIQRFEHNLTEVKGSAALMQAMQKAYPALPVDDGLAIGAKVATGEMKW